MTTSLLFHRCSPNTSSTGLQNPLSGSPRLYLQPSKFQLPNVRCFPCSLLHPDIHPYDRHPLSGSPPFHELIPSFLNPVSWFLMSVSLVTLEHFVILNTHTSLL